MLTSTRHRNREKLLSVQERSKNNKSDIFMSLTLGIIVFAMAMTLVMTLFKNSAHAAISESSSQQQSAKEEAALEEFEQRLEAFRDLIEKAGDEALTHKIQQYDSCQPGRGGWVPRCAVEVSPHSDLRSYEQAINDKYYGYQIFILVDKSVSRQSSRSRDWNRQAQTVYVFKREGNSIQRVTTYATSTGREPRPNSKDTREGYMRVQWANQHYVSRTYGEAMPFSLWFESEYGTAIHQTTTAKCNAIGVRASAGCVRLCQGDAKQLFDLVTSYSRDSNIVLLDKRTGAPIQMGTDQAISQRDLPLRVAPKVIRGYPAFVRIIDGTSNASKQKEIENLIADPTNGFKQYFHEVDRSLIRNMSL